MYCKCPTESDTEHACTQEVEGYLLSSMIVVNSINITIHELSVKNQKKKT